MTVTGKQGKIARFKLFEREIRGDKFLRNGGKLASDFVASHLRGQCFEIGVMLEYRT
jgi:hypothetical protein